MRLDSFPELCLLKTENKTKKKTWIRVNERTTNGGDQTISTKNLRCFSWLHEVSDVLSNMSQEIKKNNCQEDVIELNPAVADIHSVVSTTCCLMFNDW